MTNEFKIYYFERFISITSSPENSGVEQKYWYNFENKQHLFELISTFQKNKTIPSIAILCVDPYSVVKEVKNHYRYLKSAGGLVRNCHLDYLFIYRLEKWDLPKGKMDGCETPNLTALREVKEETGLKKLLILKELPSTYHTYWKEDEFILKRTYWFEILARNNENVKPQIEENITEVRWFHPDKFGKIYANTYASILDIISTIQVK